MMNIDDLEPSRVFGTWDAPATDGAVQIDVPTYLACMYCREKFTEGDDGAITPTGIAQHKECSLRSVAGGIGHHVDHNKYCHGPLGPDAGLSARMSARMVWRHVVEKWPVTENDLNALRASDLQEDLA